MCCFSVQTSELVFALKDCYTNLIMFIFRMNLYWYEIFAAVYMKLGGNAWCLVLRRNDMFCLTDKYMADPKAYRLEISGPAEICRHLHKNGTRVSRLGPATETKSDRSKFIARPVSCKRNKRNVWRPIRGTDAGLSSSRSHLKPPLKL